MHNDDHKILQILDQSACLSKSQLLGYLNRSLYPEELRAVELHLSSCTLCNDALDGFEAVQNAESLIASMVPPVLPAIILPEKPVEKKEPEAQPAYVPSKKRSRVKVNAEAAAPEPNKYNSNPQGIWLKTMGAAAALIIGFGLIWYYELGSKKNTENIAANIPNADTEPRPVNDMSTQSLAAPKPDSLQLLAEKKAKDSVYLATVKVEKLKAQKDSLANIALARKADTVIVSADKPLLAANEKEKEETNNPPEPTAKKQVAAPSAAMAPKKEEDTKTAKSDFELGMQQYKQNNFASALLYFKTAESNDKDPKHWEAVYLSGMCNKSLDRKRKAVKYFERVVAAKASQAKAAQKQLDDLNK
ncbi:hypothetical protein F0919_17570 [Taibaiella lutea]|uniref:Zinc-finger domain-containing protein n=1 Tax=Taibaiella lutea TaxID=2608001 RepID=A0A5M6CC05_9BACT|nr:hypothetical protein [Taibaiella lutea]KAA5532591.1 hypothetical protein F0919_17570 [Taibaiella lutea]